MIFGESRGESIEAKLSDGQPSVCEACRFDQ